MSGSIFFTNASPRTIDDSAIDKVGDWVVHSDLSRKTNSTQDAGQPFSQPTSQSEAAFNSSHDHDANTDNYDEFHRGSGNSGGDPEQYQQTSTGNDQGTKNAYSRSTDGQTTAEDPPSNLANKNWTRNFNGYVTSYRENDNRVVNARAIDNYEYYSKNNQGDDDLENLPASHDDDTHQNAGQPFSSSQPTSQPEADFDGSHDHDTDTNNYDGFQHSSGNSGGDPEQYDQQTSGNDQETKNAYNQNTDSQTPAEDPLSNPINKEHSDGTSRGVWDRRRQSLLKLDVKRIRLRWDDILGEYVPEDDEPKASRDRVTGRYTEQDNRRIGHNAENVENYYEDSTVNNGVINNSNNNIHNQDLWKTFVAGGGVATTAFYAGHTTAAVQGSAIPTNNAIAIIYPQYSFDQAPSLVVSFVILPVVLMNLFSLVRQRLVAGVM